MRVVRTLCGKTIDVSEHTTVEDIRRRVSRCLGVPETEVLLTRGRNVWTNGDEVEDDESDLRAVHRPPPPSLVWLRSAAALSYGLVVAWYAYVDVSVAGLLLTLCMCAGFRWTGRGVWERLVPPPGPRRNDKGPPTRHLVVVPLYNEDPDYLEPLMEGLLGARRDWPVTVLFAAEARMDEGWIRRASERLRAEGIAATTVRHPPRLLHEVPGAASNLNWALETFCFEVPDPHDYLLTKCDSNGVVEEGYLTELEGIAASLGRTAFFAQPDPSWSFGAGCSWYDQLVLDSFSKMLRVGEGGITHFSFPLTQFVAVGRYSHSNVLVLDDMDCYLQQERHGARFVRPRRTIRKRLPSGSDLVDRLAQKWIPQAFGTAVVETSARRGLVYSFRVAASLLFFDVFAVGLKSILLVRRAWTT